MTIIPRNHDFLAKWIPFPPLSRYHADNSINTNAAPCFPRTIGVPVFVEPGWDRTFSVYIRGCLLLFEFPSFQVSFLYLVLFFILLSILSVYTYISTYIVLGSILPLDLSLFLYIHFLLCKAIESSTLPSPHSTFLPTFYPTQSAYHHASF